MDPRILAQILARPSYNEWESMGHVGGDDEYNAANPPGPRQQPFNLDVLQGVTNRALAQPGPQEDFERRLYEKGKLEDWKGMLSDPMFGNMGTEAQNRLFPWFSWLPVTKASASPDAMGATFGTGGQPA